MTGPRWLTKTQCILGPRPGDGGHCGDLSCPCRETRAPGHGRTGTRLWGPACALQSRGLHVPGAQGPAARLAACYKSVRILSLMSPPVFR